MEGSSTLVGIATGTPDGGVAIVRLSGPTAFAILEGLAQRTNAARRLVRRVLRLADGQAEDALVVEMPAPASFTGEDVVELHVHAGRRNVRAVVDRCLALGAVAAGRGDFSRRAFERGRLTLDEAEGLAAVIAAQTEEGLRQAKRLAAGEVGREVDARATEVIELRAEVEANLDFPEDVDPADVGRWLAEVEEISANVRRWLGGFEAGRRAREQARVVLAGPPNAGKSSLFNALLGTERTIVAAIAGTTRDFVEADVEVGNHCAVLVDTAGLRETSEEIEAAGIARSEGQVEGADVVLWVEASDAPALEPPPTDAMLLRIETKRDVRTTRPEALGVVLVGARAREGIDDIRRALQEWFASDGAAPWIGLRRHRDRAVDAVEALARAEGHLREDSGLELVAFELAIAHTRLAEIRGRSALGPVATEVMDLVFSRFCIGK